MVMTSAETQIQILANSEAREWRHDSDKTQTNKLKWWITEAPVDDFEDFYKGKSRYS